MHECFYDPVKISN